MTPQTWVSLIGVTMQFIVLILAAGIYFGRQESKGTRKDDSEHTVVVRATHPDLLDLTDHVARLESRLTIHEQEWRENREKWHQRFDALEQARFAWIKDADALYVRRETSEANFNGVWAAIKGLRQQVSRARED